MTDLRYASDRDLRHLLAEAERRIDERSPPYAPGVVVDEAARVADIERWRLNAETCRAELARRVEARRQAVGMPPGRATVTGEPGPHTIVATRPAPPKVGSMRVRRAAEMLGAGHVLAAMAAMPLEMRLPLVDQAKRIVRRAGHDDLQEQRRKERQRARAARRRNR